MSKILKVIGRQVFDSRGNPTVEAEVFLNNKVKASAIVPFWCLNWCLRSL